jgi:tripartite-type tricarboxylate transporter receptor subunit TctC
MPALSRIAWAQAYPSRTVRIIVGFPPGGAADIISRLIAQWLTERLGQTFVIENRAGAGGNIAAEALVRAPSDGYTLGQVGANNAINTSLYDKLTYNFVRDVAPVAGLYRLPLVLEVNSSVPAKTVPEFIAYAEASRLSMSSFGNGTSSHLAGELFKMMAGVEMVHVPYRGSAPALTDLLAGQVQVALDSVPASIEFFRTGRLRPLAVTTATRSETLPTIPTIGDFLPGYEASGWGGIGVPRNTPTEIVDKLNKQINAGLADPKIKTRLEDMGYIMFASSPSEFGKLMVDDTEKWRKVIRAANIKPE